MKKFQLEEQDGHVVSYTVWGNAQGPTILSFHGGPGSKSKPHHAERYDLGKYQVVLFDQRGCGESTPLGLLEHNTTEHLLADAERIREVLGIENWFVSGGSWGSTLSLLYALKYPSRTKGLLLSSVFLADADTVAWAMGQSGAAVMMPDVWEKRMAFFKEFNIQLETQNDDLIRAYDAADLETQKRITAGIFNWEGNLFTPQATVTYTNPEDISANDIASARIFVHYERHSEFIPENYIHDNIQKIAEIPTVIVHGRYDILCPLQKAKVMAEKMKNCELVIATSSGHKLTAEGETIQFMAYDRFLERYS